MFSQLHKISFIWKWCFIGFFPVIYIVTRVNTFLLQQNKIIDVMVGTFACISKLLLYKPFLSNFFGNSYCNTNISILVKKSLTFVYSRQHSQSLYLIPHVSHLLLSCPCLHLILWIPSAGLSTRFENKFAINLALSIN